VLIEDEPFQPLLDLVLCCLSFGILGILACHLLSVPVCPSREGSKEPGLHPAGHQTACPARQTTSGNKTKNK
jgi:hypothetical protein